MPDIPKNHHLDDEGKDNECNLAPWLTEFDFLY